MGRIMICSLKITKSGVVLRRKRIPLQQKTKSIYKMKKILLIAALLAAFTASEASQPKRTTIKSGELWPDDSGWHINAHGGGIMKYGDTYYWFGEHKADTTSSAMVGVTCYASEDLLNWRNCGVALSVSDEKGHDIERGCILERPKVIYNKVTKKFCMWFHLELKGRGYSAARYGVAVSDCPEGCLLYTSPSPRDKRQSRMPSSA